MDVHLSQRPSNIKELVKRKKKKEIDARIYTQKPQKEHILKERTYRQLIMNILNFKINARSSLRLTKRLIFQQNNIQIKSKVLIRLQIDSKKGEIRINKRE